MGSTLGLTLAACAALATSCGSEHSGGQERAPIREVIAVASAPAEFIAATALGSDFVERVGADWAPSGSPSDGDLKALVTARRVLLMGAEFEPWAQRAGLPPSRTIDLSRGLGAAALISTATVTHTHGQGPAHSHGGVVPTTWTDPALLQAMIHNAGELLTGALPVANSAEAAEAAVERRRAAEDQLMDYVSALLELKTALGGRRLFATSHGLEYVARDVEAPLLVTLLEIEGGGPRNDHAASLLEAAAAEPGHAGVLVWLGPIDADFAAIAAESLGLKSVTFDLALDGSGPTLLSRLAASARALATAVKPD